MRIYLGIDGGQSSTTAVVGDETGRVLGEGHAGPCNHVAEPERRGRFFAAIGDSVREAARQAGVAEQFAAVCAGFSGGAADKDALTRELIRAEHYLITNDAHVALTGATGGGPGIIVIAGTGSIAYGRNGAGESVRAGGWGYVFGDEGGAFDLVRQGLRAALREGEGWGQHTSLRNALMEATGVESMNELLHRFYSPDYPRERVAQLAPLVEQAAIAGDAVALAILDNAAQALSVLAAAVRRQLFPEANPPTIHYIGGVFQCELLLARFRMLATLDGVADVEPPKHSPAYGALLEALHLCKQS
jgi:N-acetylglucosamine kinase-like BadF-type ATPase